jgi:hypothetical protein
VPVAGDEDGAVGSSRSREDEIDESERQAGLDHAEHGERAPVCRQERSSARDRARSRSARRLAGPVDDG